MDCSSQVHISSIVSLCEIQMKELPTPHGDCEQSEDYVQSKCLAECNAKYVIGMCNCKDIQMPGKNRCDVYMWILVAALHHCVRYR